MKQLLIALLFILPTALCAQETTIPSWFMDDLKANIGMWIADNATYVTEEEPYDSYVMEWTWGIGQTSIIGRLYGISNGQETGDFWQFRQYWDNIKQEGTLVQFGNGGVNGMGKIQPVKNGGMEAIQTFSMPDGTTWVTKHDLLLDGTSLLTTSYDKDAEGNWMAKRTYTWEKQ
jgi:hypothetical protein